MADDVTRLNEYRRKRRRGATPEPMDTGGSPGDDEPVFVVQRHDARRLHYDLRLEMSGTLASWALPKGLPLETGERYLAVHTEDHPMEYADFSGVIPKGQYGAGLMEIWDRGTYVLEERKRDGGLTVHLRGERLQGRWTLVPAHLDGDERNWLIIKKHNDKPREAVAASTDLLPMLAGQTERLPAGDDWLFEVKWDGFRALGAVRGNEATLRSRTGVDLSSRFAAVARALPHAVRTPDCVVDGEVCALDEQGRPSFGLLQRDGGPLVYYVFDLLELERRPLVDQPLERRREQLEALILPDNPIVRISAAFDDGQALYQAALDHGLEGVMAKKRGSTYRPGRRSREWLKLKARQTAEFTVAGFTRGEGSREELGALVLAEPDDEGALRWVGNVGSGLDGSEVARLLRLMEPLRRTSPTISPAPRMPRVKARDLRWVEPELRARVQFTERTRDGRLRAPVYKGLAAKAERSSRRVEVTNADKVFFPEDGITKGDVFGFYERIAPVLVPHLRDRPFTMLRYPDGIAGKHFFQKDAPSHMPSFVKRFEHEGISYALVNDADSLLWMANMGCIDLHPWLARRDRPDRPDLVMFDLDPADGVPYATVVKVALILRDALTALDLVGVPKTSGGKGMHVLVPIERRYEHAEARGFVAAVARAIAATHPELVTTRWRKSERHGVLIDANQNGLGRTTAGVYSVRPKPGAPVSTPLRWEELDDKLDPRAFTMEAVERRISRFGDLAESLRTLRQRLPS
jgi:bifunctional non-homologous end joining protein LigD